MTMADAAIAAGTRLLAAMGGLAGATVFGVLAVGQPLQFLISGAPVSPNWAIHAWVGPLAGLPMAALAFFTLAMLWRPPAGPAQWEAMAGRCLRMGLWGLGIGAAWAAAALVGALWLYGRSTIDVSSAGIVAPMIAVLAGLSLVVTVNLVRMGANGVWPALGHIVWGLLGIVALAIGIPMLIDAAAIDDSRTLVKRFSLLIVFYPALWLTFAAIAAGITVCGVRWLRFGLSAHQGEKVSPPQKIQVRPVACEAVPVVVKKAA